MLWKYYFQICLTTVLSVFNTCIEAAYPLLFPLFWNMELQEEYVENGGNSYSSEWEYPRRVTGEDLYQAAGGVIEDVLAKKSTIKTLCYSGEFRSKAQLYALVCETLRCKKSNAKLRWNGAPPPKKLYPILLTLLLRATDYSELTPLYKHATSSLGLEPFEVSLSLSLSLFPLSFIFLSMCMRVPILMLCDCGPSLVGVCSHRSSLRPSHWQKVAMWRKN